MISPSRDEGTSIQQQSDLAIIRRALNTIPNTKWHRQAVVQIYAIMGLTYALDTITGWARKERYSIG